LGIDRRQENATRAMVLGPAARQTMQPPLVERKDACRQVPEPAIIITTT
jgi:hypothetical protein